MPVDLELGPEKGGKVGCSLSSVMLKRTVIHLACRSLRRS